MIKRSLTILFLVVTICFVGGLHGQNNAGSPYSRYGIGDIYNNNNNTSMPLGGTALAYFHPCVVNFQNPASYTAIDTLSFVFEGGVSSKIITLKTQKLNQSSNFASLSNLLFGFPITRRWKSSIGLLPYSQVGYKVVQTEYVTNVGLINKEFTGSGGINQVFWGNAFQITRDLSVGVNTAFLFGTLDKSRALVFPDSAFIYNTQDLSTTSVADFLFTFGLQYHTKLSEKMSFSLGATYTPSRAINAWDEQLTQTYVAGSTGLIYVKDTINYQPEVKGKIDIPSAYGFGFMFMKRDRWTFGMDLKMQDWKNYKYFGKNDSLQNSYQVSAGFQLLPDISSINSYMKKVTYRIGARYGKTYLQLRENQLDEVAISAGFGFPLNKTRSMVNIGFEYGRRGTTNQNLIEENFFRVTLGVSVCDMWFYRRKFE